MNVFIGPSLGCVKHGKLFYFPIALKVFLYAVTCNDRNNASKNKNIVFWCHFLKIQERFLVSKSKFVVISAWL